MLYKDRKYGSDVWWGNLKERVNSLFDCKESYNNNQNFQLQEREDIQAQIFSLFNAGFLMWR